MDDPSNNFAVRNGNGDGDDTSIRSDRSTKSFKNKFSKLFRRRKHHAAQAAESERAVNNSRLTTDVAAIYAIRHADDDDDDDRTPDNMSFGPEESAMSPTSAINGAAAANGTGSHQHARPRTPHDSSLSLSTPAPGGKRVSVSSEDSLCKHNFQHDQPYGGSSKRKLPNPMAKRRSKSATVGTASQPEGVRVLLQSASGIMAADRSGTSDPFVVLRIGRQKHTSRTINKTLAPIWNDEFFLDCEQGNGLDVLRLELYDRDRFGTDYLGTASVAMSQVPIDAPTQLTLKLRHDGRKHSSRLPADLGVLKVTVTRTFDQNAKAKVKEAAATREGLRVLLKGGRDLMVADRDGTSDPFAVVRLGRNKHQSKTQPNTLNPDWNEEFFLTFDQGGSDLRVELFDRDRFGTDYMGSAIIPTQDLELDKPKELEVDVVDDGRKTSKPLPSALGRVLLTVTRVQTRVGGKKPRRTKTTDTGLSDLRVVDAKILTGSNLLRMDANGEADPYVKVTIGQQTKKSKVVYKNRHNPTWNQAFRFEVHDQATIIKFEVFDKDYGKDEFMGVATASLSELPRNEAKQLWLKLNNDGDAGELQVVLSVSHPFSDDADKEEELDPKKAAMYCGKLQVHIRSARALAAKDAGRSSDPFVVCELGNKRKRTKTIPKTCNPAWDETLHFNVLDVFDVLRLTVYDEDRGGKVDFLGALVIPLLEIDPEQQQERYLLKNKTLDGPYKGELTVGLRLEYNPLPAYMRLIKKREVRFFEDDVKLKIGVLRQNVQRVRALVASIVTIVRGIDRLFNWDFGIPRTIAAMLFWIWATLYMYFYHVPFFFALYLLYRRYSSSTRDLMPPALGGSDEEEDDDDDEEAEKSRRSQGRTAWYTALKNIALEVQNRLGDAASMGEKVKNFFNWSVPTITGIVAVVAMAAGFVLFLIPLRYILLVWGVRRFLKKGRMKYYPPKNIDKHREPVSEIKELLGRIPDDIEKVQRRQLFPEGRSGKSDNPGRSRSQSVAMDGEDEEDDDDL